jgi:HSP20 family protein
MASANNPTQAQPEATQQDGRARSQVEGNGERTAVTQSETRARSEERPAARGTHAISAARPARDLLTGAGGPLEAMWQMSRNMDRLMSLLGMPLLGSNFVRPIFQQGRDDSWAAATFWSPRVDVEQKGDAIVIRADLPGVRKEDIRVEATEEGVTILGERREEREEGGDEQGYKAIERSYGSFFRTVPLPQKLNLEKLTAKMQDGVLQITVPLDESARPRRIQIES